MMLIFGATLGKRDTAESLIPALLTFVVLRIVLAISVFTLPQNDGRRPVGDGDWNELKELLTDRDWQTFLILSLLSAASTSVFYTFFPIYLCRAGVSDNWQGYFWVIAVLAEVAFMTWFTEPLIKRIGLKGLFLLGVAGRAFRFTAYAFLLPFPILLAMQTLHSLTFAAVHTSSVTWVSLKAPGGAKALIQTFYASVLVGIGTTIGAQVGGIISEHFGLRFAFGLAGAINALVFLLGWLRLKEPSG